MQAEYPLYVANRPERPNADLEVVDKYSGEVVTRVPLADAATIDRAIAATVAAAEPMRTMRPYQRQAVLQHCVRRFQERLEELALTLCVEAGKPIRDSRGEVHRVIDTFRVAAEESVRIDGEVLNLEISPRARGYRGMSRRVPIGPCSFISPFNFPLNLAAHKIAPALAAGCPFLLKPASFTPVGALLIGEILAEAELPPGAFSILPCPRDAAAAFTTDERLKLLSFTGSPEVGWELKRKAGKKRVVLELGGNAACVVDETADLVDAVSRIVVGAFYQSGQSCISVQRILVHDSVYDRTREMLVDSADSCDAGIPSLEETFIGPLIAESEAVRLEAWIAEATACGGKAAVRWSADRVHAGSHAARKRAAGAQPLCRGSVWTGGGHVLVLEFRGRAAASEQQSLRPAGRDLHSRSLSRTASMGCAGGRSRCHWRCAFLAGRPYALRRRKGQRFRSGRSSVRD